MLFNLAIKNLVGAGMRTWLNVFVTAVSFFMIIFVSGMYDGMRSHAKQVTIDTEVAGGAYWHPEYDPLDAFSYEDSHGVPPVEIRELIENEKAFSILVSQASIYPNGRMMPVMMKGIEPEQSIVNIPTKSLLKEADGLIPVLMGSGMAKYTKLKVGDSFAIRWLDANKTYDADEGVVIHIMETENFKVDVGTIWIPLERAQTMLDMENEATFVTFDKNISTVKDKGKWIYRDVNYLMRDMEAMIEADEPGAQIMYLILLALAGMGIFNSQILSIFRRRKEIGTLMAVGMTRFRVVGLFTLEGGMNAFFALIMTLILGGPVFIYFALYGIPLPIDYSEMGLIVAKRLIPVYSMGLFVTTTIFISFVVLILSYLPSRRIAKMKPTDALRGKVN
ncbi:MAG: ABC transporter permease [Candidatus Marinimicrobia bacterium]|jgi:ABC-type lipoprotein release transport system permease subunit|nr:ABC transporter permease [Candidatus Neomarinimicrobiota bacterium]MBT3617764.1 ABC transporter permease [Candidatus Neomarinimicrobiota bacterium]MBT3828361.1 ABC transporter permease [Candidatus Neomarinimicrobiota bacterium]MBT3997585.1 ABC transporter permease [Candidatus Neomarinimicrobiota bacterium]MBT4280746.1 ABC transporter permease [Candidatus Neomarinimicrobiota bacterium]